MRCHAAWSLCQAAPAKMVEMLQPVQIATVRFHRPDGSPQPFDGRWRYFSVVSCQRERKPSFASLSRAAPSAPCLYLLYKDAADEAWVAGRFSRDGLNFSSPRILLPSTWPRAAMTHNTAFVWHGGALLAVGGRERSDMLRLSTGNRVFRTRARAWCFENSTALSRARLHGGTAQSGTCSGMLEGDAGMQARTVARHWEAPRQILTGTQPGCMEHAFGAAPEGERWPCEFDGRFSLVRFRGEWLLYARANTARGTRFVQLTRSSDLEKWGPFGLIDLEGWAYSPSAEPINVYFWAVSHLPTVSRALFALAPVVHRGKGCVALACSAEGERWSPLTAFLPCDTDFPPVHTYMQPAAGMVVRGEFVDVYVHADVGEIMGPTRPPGSLVRYSLLAERLAGWAKRNPRCAV